MAANVENFKKEIEEKLVELAKIQPKDAMLYMKSCKEAYDAYYNARGVESRHSESRPDLIIFVYEQALTNINKLLEEFNKN